MTRLIFRKLAHSCLLPGANDTIQQYCMNTKDVDYQAFFEAFAIKEPLNYTANHFGRHVKVKAHIVLTCPCDKDPFIPNFYIVKLGFTGVYIIF